MNSDKRYLKVFANQVEYESQKDSILEQPYVVLLEDTEELIFSIDPYDPTNGYEYVDLGLPSGIKWAKLNVGATKESDPGLFFQWGDTQGYTLDQCGNGEGQKAFRWEDYKWCDGSPYSLTKYCTSSSYGDGGFTDNKVQLDLEDDGCHVHMGGNWRLPTGTNIQELIDNTNYEHITIEGMYGRKFTNKADSSKYIFLPDVCCSNGEFVLGTGIISWSASLSDFYNYDAQILYISGTPNIYHYNSRCSGLSLRGVIDKVNNNTNTTVEVDETSINLLSNVEVTEDSITLLGNNIKIDSDENNNYNIIIE